MPLSPLLEDAAQRAARYLEGLADRPVAPTEQSLSALEAFLAEPLSDAGEPAARVLAGLDEHASPATMASAGGRYFGLVIGGAHPVSVAASWLAAAWDQNAGGRLASPAAAAIEEAALRDLLEILGLPPDCEGSFVSGATMASFTALAAARSELLAKQGWDVERRGLRGAPELRVLLSDEIHPSIRKALGLLGLGRERAETLPVDAQGRIVASEAARRIDGPALVIAQAGNVNTGACDPFEALADATERAGGWLHVDGAFGLWAAASPRLRPLVAGIERADSWATDAHKWLNVPYDSGLAFVRNREAVARVFAMSAAYLPSSGRDRHDTTPEMSRRARAVEIFATLRTLGRRGVAALVERCCDHAQRFARGLEAAGFEILNEVVLNQVLVSFGSEDRTQRVIRDIQRDGTCWCGPTQWQGRSAMRISVSSWATTEDDVERSLEAMIRCAAKPRAVGAL